MSDERQAQAPRIVAIDDDAAFLRVWQRLLRGYRLVSYTDPREALARLDEAPVDLLLVDMELPGLSGLEVMRAVRHRQPLAEAIMVTGRGTFDLVVEAMRAGAYDFFAKPLEAPELVLARIERALERGRLRRVNAELRRRVEALAPASTLVGESRALREVRALVAQVADSPAPVLITGESGTGKELVARALHGGGRRAGGPFVPVNCAAIPEGLVDSELFGHERGAFTGALAAHRGLFEAAHQGTLFLDEIGDVPAATQVRLLRALQEGEVRPVGSTQTRKLEVRVVAATNANLERALRDGRFRSDLYYRLSTFRIELPPLRARAEDVPPIAQALLGQAAARADRKLEGFSDAAMEALVAYQWPGNVRELANAIEHAVTLAAGPLIEREELPSRVTASRRAAAGAAPEPEPGHLPRFADERDRRVREFERDYLERLVRVCAGNLSEAARRSGIDRPNLRRMLKRAGIEWRASDEAEG